MNYPAPTETITGRIPPDVADALRARAVASERTISSEVRIALREYVADDLAEASDSEQVAA